MNKTSTLTAALTVALTIATVVGAVPNALAAGPISQTPRGAVIETDRYRATITDGVLAGLVNKLTGEEYLAKEANVAALLTRLPAGLGTQHTPTGRESAGKLYGDWVEWKPQPDDAAWPCQHYPTPASTFTFASKADGAAVLTYKGLTSGTNTFADETFSLEIAVEAGSGDLLVTPVGASGDPGVFSAALTVTALAPEVTVEAPIFEGVRLDRHMQPVLSSIRWGCFWDYGFVALNGQKTGAIGLWCQDAELRYHKQLFYLVNDQGLSLSLAGLNLPPFAGLKEARPMTWRLQAFDKSWAQAAARFRDWRTKNVKIAPRPEWVQKLSFLSRGGQHASANMMTNPEKFFENTGMDRVISWASDVRGAGFDKNHANNTPYPGFREDMKAWQAKNRKLMVYLIPVIMWGPKPETDRERQGLAFAKEAMVRAAFSEDANEIHKSRQLNLASPQWQRWFLDWVKEYIQDYGCNGIYHDMGHVNQIEARGLINGMTFPQGLADYFYKAATENPGSIHGAEHLTEVNSVGVSLGLGCGILWGEPGLKDRRIAGPGTMNWQRIKRASPLSNALHYPHSAIFAFPHFSELTTHGIEAFHWGMDQMERRGDLPGNDCGGYGAALNLPPDQWANDTWIDRQRALLFVRNGLRPTFPEDWDRKVLSYFKGDKGQDFRYEELPCGTAFVQYDGARKIVHYARISGVTRAGIDGGILGWPCYDAQGPAGLNPDVTYCVDGNLSRPGAWFEIDGNAARVVDGYSHDSMIFVELANSGEGGAVGLTLHAPAQPKGVWVDGVAVKVEPAGAGAWRIPMQKDSSFVVAMLQEPPAGVNPLAVNLALNRLVDSTGKRDQFKPAAFAADLTQNGARVAIGNRAGVANAKRHELQTHIPIKAPADGVLKISGLQDAKGEPFPGSFRVNGKTAQVGDDGIAVPLKSGELAVLTIVSSPGPKSGKTGPGFKVEWR
jgi:hypothetical protein